MRAIESRHKTASRTEKKNKKKKAKQHASPLETLLVPVASVVVVTSAALRSRHCEPEPRPEARREDGPATKPSAPGGPDDVDAHEDPPKGGLKAKLDALGQRFPPLGLALAVQKRYGEVRGNNVAAAVTLQSFLALFPLMLVIVAVVGFVAAGSSDVAGRIVSSLGLSGEAAKAVQQAVATAERSRKAASIIGLGGLLWSGLGLVNAFQYALNQVWQVEERGVKDKAVGLAWLVGSALLLVAGAAFTTALGWLPGVLSPLGILAAVGLNFCLWLWTFKVLPNRDVGWRPLADEFTIAQQVVVHAVDHDSGEGEPLAGDRPVKPDRLVDRLALG